jgi:signal transduction histidine kinase
MDHRSEAVQSVQRAQAELDNALKIIRTLPVTDPKRLEFCVHALNNYLTITSGTLEMTRLALPKDMHGDIPRWLEGLQHTCALMTNLVGQVMNPKPGEHRKLFVFKEVDLVRLASNVCAYYLGHAKEKNISLVCDESNSPVYVVTDVVEAAIVLDNLISNAVKFSPPGTSVHVSVRKDNDSVVCWVRDEGPGLTPEEQAVVFDEGVMLSPKPTGGESSSGYGLAVAKLTTEGLKGRLWCDSEKGRGSTFALQLPCTLESP